MFLVLAMFLNNLTRSVHNLAHFAHKQSVKFLLWAEDRRGRAGHVGLEGVALIPMVQEADPEIERLLHEELHIEHDTRVQHNDYSVPHPDWMEGCDHPACQASARRSQTWPDWKPTPGNTWFLPPEQFDEFERMLNEPPKENKKLRELLNQPSVFDNADKDDRNGK